MAFPEREPATKIVGYSESRKILEDFVTGEDAKTTSLADIRNLITERKLWFGFNISYADYLLCMEASGEIEIELEEGTVIFTPVSERLT